MSDDWKSDDPFVDPQDPEAREREQRRLEREEKRKKREAKRSEKEASKKPPSEPVPPTEPPRPPRTPEQEFWDEDPEPVEPPAGVGAKPAQEPAAPAEPAKPPKADQPAEPARPTAAAKKPSEPARKPVEPAAAAPAAKSSKPEPEQTQEQKRPKPAAAEAAAAAAAAGAAADPAPTPAPEAPIEQSWEAEPPAPPDPDVWGDEGDPSKARAVSRRRDGGGDEGGRGGASGRRQYHPFRIAAVIVVFLLIWFLYALFQPFHSDGSDPVQVKIPKGASVSEVGDLLIDKGVIEDPILPISGSTLFQIRVTVAGKRSDLYAGNFTLTKDMSYGSAIDALTTPPVKRTTTVTIPEGYTRSQAAELVEEDGVPGSYTKKTVKSKYLDPAEYGGKNAKDLEGFLFPNTFELKPKAPVTDLVELQLKDFKKQIKKVNMKYAKSKNLTVFDVLIIASMIEREAGIAKQRKLVAAVIYNRLKEGMPLGIDATIRFATGNYSQPLTESELAIDSPYNTRTNQGLPPGPINSPGLDAIQAAAHPAKSDFIFYVNKPNTCGELAFSASEDEFEADVAAYNKAREENGGNEPTSCGE
jgi:peptidoglycan lytic transglycosylase G